MNTNTTGGVSPLKRRGGKHAGAATAKAGDWTSRVTGGRGGFAQSTDTRNRGGYNALTRFFMEEDEKSPLQARQSSRGGKHAGKATQTARKGRGTYEGPGGFAKSTGKRGAGGRNVGGYNVGTRFAPSVIRPFPGSGGTTTIKKPYSYDKDGKLQIDPLATKKWTDPTKGGTTTGKTEKERPGYQEAYDAMEDKDGGKYNPRNEKTYMSYEEFEKDAKQFNKDNPDYKEYETKKVTKKGKPGFWTYYDPDGGEISLKEYKKYKNRQ